MPTPIEIVERFCATWDQGMEAVQHAVSRDLMPGTVWEDVGWSQAIRRSQHGNECARLMGVFELEAGKIARWLD